MVDNEDGRLRYSGEQEDNRIKERLLEFHVSAYFRIFLKDVPQPDMIQCIIVGKNKQNNLSKETYGKPSVENSVRGSYMGNVFQRLGIGKVVKIDRSQYSNKSHLLLGVLQVNQVHFGQ